MKLKRGKQVTFVVKYKVYSSDNKVRIQFICSFHQLFMKFYKCAILYFLSFSIKQLLMSIKTFRTLVNHYNCSFFLNSNSPKLNNLIQVI